MALPLEATGLTVIPLAWQEPLIAALPAHWSEAEADSLTLTTLSERPLFWFKRERNPAFFDGDTAMTDAVQLAMTGLLSMTVRAGISS